MPGLTLGAPNSPNGSLFGKVLPTEIKAPKELQETENNRIILAELTNIQPLQYLNWSWHFLLTDFLIFLLLSPCLLTLARIGWHKQNQ